MAKYTVVLLGNNKDLEDDEIFLKSLKDKSSQSELPNQLIHMNYKNDIDSINIFRYLNKDIKDIGLNTKWKGVDLFIISPHLQKELEKAINNNDFKISSDISAKKILERDEVKKFTCDDLINLCKENTSESYLFFDAANGLVSKTNEINLSK
ncbi:hypothetical protein L3V83_11230 [Thiotrichales bacterium 19X7-9]|nr:hypothetical protein [Thiotrichales bacterium 19X7-9]